mgnify:CR=1 FL=1
MFNYLLLYFVLYFFLLGTVVIFGLYRNRRKEATYSDSKHAIDLQNLILLIPFRNEEHRLITVIDSLNKSIVLPKEVIFINDHSADNSVALIEKEIKIDNYRIIHTPENICGKKAAIRYGIDRSVSEFILTTDADIAFHSTYFESIAKLQQADLYLMPVTMKAKKLFGELYEIDLILVNAVNVGLAGLKRPIMASGANLLFSRAKFNEFDSFEKHKHVASGDDMYLLRDFRDNKANVRLISNPEFGVETETPQSFKEFIDQRLRWIGKTSNLNDSLNSSTTYIQAAFAFVFLVIIALFVSYGEWRIVCAIMILKSVVDMLMFGLYFNRINRMTTWLFIPVYELLFPFYSLLLLVLVPTYKPKWKGREIYKL